MQILTRRSRGRTNVIEGTMNLDSCCLVFLTEVVRTLIVFGILVCALPCLAQSSGGIGPGGIGPVKGSRDSHTLKHPVIQSKPEPSWPKIKNKVETPLVLRAIFRSN